MFIFIDVKKKFFRVRYVFLLNDFQNFYGLLDPNLLKKDDSGKSRKGFLP